MFSHLKSLWFQLPWWMKIVYPLFLAVGIIIFIYVFSVCGWKTLLLGNGGLFAALSGMCN